MNVEKINNWRYSTKSFDTSKKISDSDFAQIKSLLRMSPSSTNIQPWHFIIANTPYGKERIAKGTQGLYQFNEAKVLNASHVVVFCARTSADADYMDHLIQVEEKDGRYPNDEVKEMMFGARNMFADMHRYDIKDFQHWMEKQVYLNIGHFLMGIAALGIDALPMEGLDFKAVDEEFGLREKGYTAITAVSLGYRSDDDFNIPTKTPKSRLPESEIFTMI